MRSKKDVLMSCGATVISLLIAGAGLAADTTPPETTSDKATAEDTGLGEIVVTARRREENLQRVPIAISALSNEQLEDRAIETSDDLTKTIPDLRITGGAFFGRSQSGYQIRGIPGVAVYIDGIAQISTVGLLEDIVELDRVEVLRGPQGTLFGRNAIGGAIQFVSQLPGDQFAARAKATVGDFGREDVTLNVDVPLSDTLLTKLTAATLNQNGYVQSTTINNALGAENDKIVREMVQWRPTDGLSALLIGEYRQQLNNGSPSNEAGLNPFCPGGPRPPTYQGPPPPNAPCIYNAVGLPINPNWAYGSTDQWKTASNYTGPGGNITSLGGTAVINWTLSDTLSLKSLTGYRNETYHYYDDFDASPYNIYEAYQTGYSLEKSEELQLLWSISRLTGTTGLYFYDDAGAVRRENWEANNLLQQPYLGLRNGLGGGYAGYRPAVIDALGDNTESGWAIFSEWTYKVTDQLSATLGGRYNSDKIGQVAYPVNNPISAICCTVVNNYLAGGAPIPDQFGSNTFKNFSPRASFQYQWTPELMTYFTYSKGFGAGGFTGGNIPTLPDGGFRAYAPQILQNYEVGFRGDLFDHRLRTNLTYFTGKYTNIQVLEELASAPGFPVTVNAASADVFGGEIEGTGLITPSFAINYEFSWLHTGYTDIGTALGLTRQTPFAYAPTKSGSIGPQYELKLPTDASVVFRADLSYQTQQFTGSDDATSQREGPYATLDGRVIYKASKKWNVALFGTNLTNRYYLLGGFTIPSDQIVSQSPAKPRQFGVTFNFTFE